MHRTVFIFMVLEVGGRGAAGFRIIRNAKDCYYLHGFGSAREACDWLQNPKKSIGLPSFSWFWKRVGGGGWPQNHKAMHRTVIIFMVLEVPRRGEVGSRII